MKNIEIIQTTMIGISYSLKALKQRPAILLLLLMIIALGLPACGRRGESPEADYSYSHEGSGPRPEGTYAGDANISGTGPEADVQSIDRSQFYGETLTIYTQSRDSNNITAIANEFMRLNPGVTIDIISFGGNLERAIRETSIALGEVVLPADAPPVTPPVLIESALVNPRSTHHFVNWLPFIYPTPDFNNYNFFMNVIDAMTLDGYLYKFPITFSFNMIAANHTIPGLIQAMGAYEDGISMYQILGLMRSLNTTGYHHEETDQPMYLWHNFDAGHGFEFLQDSFDSETGIPEFNNQRFIDFLDHAHEATHPGKVFGEDYAPPPHVIASPDWTFAMWRYFFSNIDVSDNIEVTAFFTGFPRHDVILGTFLYFTGATPIVSERGELIITPTASYVLYAGTSLVQQALAWDFMQFMASEEGARAASWSLNSMELGFGMTRERLPMMNINRDAARFSVYNNSPTPGIFCTLTYMLAGAGDDSDETVTTSEAIQIKYDWMDAIGEMPMVLVQARPDAARYILQDFHNGVISAEEAAMFIQGLIEFEIAGME